MKKWKQWSLYGLAGVVLGLNGCVSQENQAAVAREERNLKLMERMLDQQDRTFEMMAKMQEQEQKQSTAQPVSDPVLAAAAVASAHSPESKKVAITGRIRSVGSDTMDQLMEGWQHDFCAVHPQVAFYHQGRGSSTAIPALMQGAADFGPMSRTLKKTEVERFKAQFGYEPIQLRVAVDAVAVYVHPDNPLSQQGITFEQLDAIFSKTRLRGGKEIRTWGDLGLVGAWSKAPVHVYGRNGASGTYAFFKSSVLTKQGEYSENCHQLVGSEQLVTAIAGDRFGIGYSGIGYKTDAVAVLPVGKDNSTEVFPPEMQYAYSGEYPLSRFLYLAVNKEPSAVLDPMRREFIDYIFSPVGMQEVMKVGFFPVSTKIVSEEKSKLGM